MSGRVAELSLVYAGYHILGHLMRAVFAAA